MDVGDLLRALLLLPDAASDMARDIDRLHFFVISITMLGAAVTAVITLWFCVRYRRRGEPSATPRIQSSRALEVGFAGGLLGLFLLFWVLGFYQYVAYASAPSGADEVYVVAKQWMWKFSYPSGKATIGALVVPKGKDTRLVMTSRDVIHSFFVPALRLKQDLLPGRYTSAWFNADREGIYDVYCAEYCGTSHSHMRASVVVLSPEDYATWADGGEPPLMVRAKEMARRRGRAIEVSEGDVTLVEQGRAAAADHGCLSCHTVDGQRHIGPTWRGLYGRAVDIEGGGRIVADEEYLTRSMMQPQAEIVRGFKPVMPTYMGTLTQPKAAAIVEYIKSLTGTVETKVDLPELAVPDAQAGSAPATEQAKMPGEGEEP